MKRFLVFNALLVLGLTGAYVLVTEYATVRFNPVVPAIFVAFALMNLLFFRMLVRAHLKRPQLFISAFIGVVGIKLFSSIVFLLIYLVAFKAEDVLYVVGALFTAYISSMILLIRSALQATSTNG